LKKEKKKMFLARIIVEGTFTQKKVIKREGGKKKIHIILTNSGGKGSRS